MLSYRVSSALAASTVCNAESISLSFTSAAALSSTSGYLFSLMGLFSVRANAFLP